MTTPSGLPGFNLTGRWGITGDTAGGDSPASLIGRTQEYVTGILKEQVKASPGWAPLSDQFVARLVTWLGDILGLSDAVESELIDFFTGKWTSLDDMFADLNALLVALFGGPTVGSTVQPTAIPDITKAMSSAVTEFNDNVANAFYGAEAFVDASLTTAKSMMDQLFASVLKNTQDIAALRSQAVAGNVGGSSVVLDFANYANGPLPSVLSVTYSTISGSPTSTLVVNNGAAQWSLVNNGSRRAIVRYNVAPTNTDFQVVRGTLRAPPDGAGTGGTPHIAALARVNAAGTDYVIARARCTGFLSYVCDLGYCVGGTETWWLTNIALGWNTDIYLKAGVGTQARRYQLVAGNTVVADYTESGTASAMDASHRFWGCSTQMATDILGAKGSGALIGSSVTDNAPPAVIGSAAGMYRTSTGTAVLTGGSTITALPSGFFGVVRHNSADITVSTSAGTFTVTVPGSYFIAIHIPFSAPIQSTVWLMLVVNGSAVRQTHINPNNAQLNAMGAVWSVPLAANDVVGFATFSSGLNVSVMTGDASGTQCYADIALMDFRNMAVI